jgi:hypothetical protein
MMAVICPSSCCALTFLSLSRMTFWTDILLVNYVSKVDYVFSLNHNRQDDIKCVGHLSTGFGVYDFCIDCMTLVNALMNYQVIQFRP